MARNIWIRGLLQIVFVYSVNIIISIFFHLLLLSNDQKHCKNLRFTLAWPANLATRKAKGQYGVLSLSWHHWVIVYVLEMYRRSSMTRIFDDSRWLQTKGNVLKWLIMTQHRCKQSLNESLWLYRSQDHYCSSLLRTARYFKPQYTETQWLPPHWTKDACPAVL